MGEFPALTCAAGDTGVARPGSPPLVLLHGWACDRTVWSPVRDALARDRELVALDLPGHGSSTRRVREWRVAGFAQLVAQAIEDLGLREPVLIGHSLGGAIALEAASRLAGGAAGVIMVDTFLFDYGRLPPARVRRFMIPFRRNLAKAIGTMVEDMAAGCEDRSWVPAQVAQMSRTAPDVALAALESLFNWDPAPAFAAARMPVYWVSGRLVDPVARRRYAALIRGETLIEAGHFPMLESGGAFVGAVRGCLDAISAP